MSDSKSSAADRGGVRRAGTLRRLIGRSHLVLASVLALALWIFTATLASKSSFKRLVDLTPQAQFTLSPGTEDLLAKLAENDQTVRIDTFFARIPPGVDARTRHIVAIRQRIERLTRDLLGRLEAIAGDNVELLHYDIYGDPRGVAKRIDELGGLREAQGVAEDLVVVSLGARRRLLRLPVDVAEIEDPASRAGTRAPGTEKQPPRMKSFVGEEALASAIRSLLVEGAPKVYFLTGMGEATMTAGVGNSYSELVGALQSEGFEIGQLQLDRAGAVPEDAAVVALLEPRGRLSDPASAALIRYLEGGGRMFVNTSWNEIAEPRFNPSFEKLAERFGFRLGNDLVCEARGEPGMQGAVRGGPGSDVLAIQQLTAHPITRPMAVARRVPILRSARPIERAAEGPGKVDYEVLLRTGGNSWLAPRDPRNPRFGVDLSLPGRREAFAPRDVGGVFSLRRADERPGQLVLLSGLAFLNGGGLATNGDLALNIFNWLARRDELVAVRGNRFVSSRVPVDQAVLDEADDLLSVFVPLGLLCAALLLLALRQRSPGAWVTFGLGVCGTLVRVFFLGGG